MYVCILEYFKSQGLFSSSGEPERQREGGGKECGDGGEREGETDKTYAMHRRGGKEE